MFVLIFVVASATSSLLVIILSAHLNIHAKMSVSSAYFPNQPIKVPQTEGQISHPYWNDHYNQLYHQYQNFYQPPDNSFCPKNGFGKDEHYLSKTQDSYEEPHVKVEQDDSTHCDDQRLPSHNSTEKHHYESSFYRNDHQNSHQHMFGSQTPLSIPSEHYFNQFHRARMYNLPNQEFCKPTETEGPCIPPKTSSPPEDNFFQASRHMERSPDPSLSPFTQEDSHAAKFVCQMRPDPPFTQQPLRNSVEFNNNGSPVKSATPARTDSEKNGMGQGLETSPAHIFPWMKTSYKGLTIVQPT